MPVRVGMIFLGCERVIISECGCIEMDVTLSLQYISRSVYSLLKYGITGGF